VAANGLAQLTLIRLPHDHFGSLGTAIAGLRTPTLQMSDNDYALGKIIESVSRSPYWQSTAIFVLEDDSQSGSDHIDSHRSFVYVISPYSKRGVTISTNYNTVNVLRTMEDLLGIEHLNVSDANAAPMADVFTETPDLTSYTAIIPGNLCAPPVDPNLVRVLWEGIMGEAVPYPVVRSGRDLRQHRAELLKRREQSRRERD
jgi:DNA-binding beta-propeller fold protein YncE